MCEHRESVPKVETGIERHWREVEEAEEAKRFGWMANALRPMSTKQMQSLRGNYMMQYQQASYRSRAGLFGGILGF